MWVLGARRRSSLVYIALETRESIFDYGLVFDMAKCGYIASI